MIQRGPCIVGWPLHCWVAPILLGKGSLVITMFGFLYIFKKLIESEIVGLFETVMGDI